MKNRIAVPPVHTLLFILLALLFGNGLRAQITYDNFLPKSDIMPGSLLTVSDPDSTQTGPGVFVNRTQYLSLVYTTEAHTDVQNYTAWSYGLVVKIMNGADTTQYFTDTLDIRRNDSLPQYQALNHYTLPWYSLHIRVLSVCGKTGVDTSCIANPHLYPLLPEDIELQAGIVRTQINGFSALLDIPTSPVEYDEGEVIESCEQQYNNRLNGLRTEYDALAEQRLTDFMGTLGISAQDMEDLSESIHNQTLAEMNRLVDTLTHAQSLYYYQCDSLPLDTAHVSLLRTVGRETFKDHFYAPYFTGFNSLCKEMYLGNQTYAQAFATDSTAFINRVFGSFDHWGLNSSNEVWSLYPPGTGACVMGHFEDTAAHWSERALAIIHDMYLQRETVLNDEGVNDSLYMVYQGAKQAIAIQTNNDFSAAVNALNENMLVYCGYGGSHIGDCNTFYNNLLSLNKAYTAALMDSVADTLTALYGLPKNMLGEPNPAITSAINGLLSEYNSSLDALDQEWASCATDSLRADSILVLLHNLTVGSNHLPSQFLASRQGNITNQYRTTNTLPTLGEWQTLTGNLINNYRPEGKQLVVNKQAAIHADWPALDACTSAGYTNHKNTTEDAIALLLTKIDSTLDTLDVYGSVSSYTYEIALARWMVDYENDPAYIAAIAEADSISTEKIENCGSGTPPPAPESYMACLTRTETELRNLQYQLSVFKSQFDTLTQTFRGISHPGGWNNANGTVSSLIEPLLGEYRFRFDSLAVALFGPCITDSVLHQQFLDIAAYDATWEETYYRQSFMPAYQRLVPLTEDDMVSYLDNNFDSLSGALDELYMTYLGERIYTKFFIQGMLTWPLDSTQSNCVDSTLNAGEAQFVTLMQDFVGQKGNYLEAGAAGISTDTTGYRESVVYHSFLQIISGQYFKVFFDEINQARLNCSDVLKNVETTQPDSPEPPTPSIEAEIAACQTEVENRFNQLVPHFENSKFDVLKLAFADETAGGMNITPIVPFADSLSLRRHQSLDPVDSLWLGCNTNPSVLNILSTIFDSDNDIAVLFENPPAFATNSTLLYVGGNTSVPDYSHLDEFPAMDSLSYMALAEQRAAWMVDKIQEKPDIYGVADSCIIHHETDSATEAQYAASFAGYQSKMADFLDTFLPLYDSTTINPDTLLLKLRWVLAAQVRETYLFLQQYVALEQEYQACENLRSQLIVWKAEPDPSRNQPKKGIANKFPVKPVGKFPLLPISPNIMDLTTSTVTVVTESGPCGNVRYLEWTPIAQAVEYDLEWAYIDSMVYLDGNPANQHPEINYRAFTLTEPTRVTVKENRFPFPGEYPNGKLYFRVRGVARVIDAAHQSYYQPQFFPWVYDWSGYAVSNAPVTFNGSNPYNSSYENNLNWQWEASFAEEGKFKRVISYHDGLNRPRQVVTHLSTDNLSVIGETLYDHEGRAAVQVLPYPEPCYELSYRNQTRADSLGGAFDKNDFELAAGNERMATTYGASEYYSVQNPFMAVENPLMHTGSIPDANKYPYTQTAFMLDNTGRPTHSGGVGADHTLNGEHATRYYYANASETELRRLFGKNVGIASHYKKNAVMDANGQLSVAYVDQEGRSVATALAGLCPDNVLPLESNQPFAFTQNLTESNIPNPVAGEWNISYGQLNEIPDNEYTFTYQYGLDRLFEGITPPCIVCEFDLEIYITDPNGNRLPLTEIMNGDSSVTDTNYFYKRLDATSYELTHPCSTGSALLNEVTFTVVMPEVNTYIIHKNLRWDKEAALADLWAASQPEVNTYTASVQTSILNTYISQINYDECEQMFPGTGFGAIPADVFDGTDTLATTGQCESYRNQMIDQITPYLGPSPSPTDEHPDENTTIVNSGIYGNDSTFWATVTSLISDGHSDPNNPEYIPPSAWASLVNGTTNISGIVYTIRNNPGEWTTELKRELVKAHPEYCWYKKCLMYAQSVPYDVEMTQQTNLTNGNPYRNPLGQGGSVSPFSNSGTIIYDPLKENPDEKPVIANKTSESPSIWENTNTIVTNNIANDSLSTSELAWQTFRGGYLQAKNDAFYTATEECPFWSDTTVAVVLKPNVPDTEEEMDNANTAAQTAWENAEPCEDICRQNAIAWTAQMFANCGETGTTTELGIYQSNKNVIVASLEQYCINHCGEQNPMGIITEEMFAAAMNSSPGSSEYPLRYAVEVFNQTFANVEGCDPITGTTTVHGTDTVTTWDTQFTYGEGEYQTSCYTVPSFWLGHKYKIIEALNLLSDAFESRTTPYSNYNSITVSAPGYHNAHFDGGAGACSVEMYIPEGCELESNGLPLYGCITNHLSPPTPPCTVGSIGVTQDFINASACRGEKLTFHKSNGDIISIPAIRNFSVTDISYDSNGDLIVNATIGIWTLGATRISSTVWRPIYLAPTTATAGYLKIPLGDCTDSTICTIFPNGWTEDIDSSALKDTCEKFLLEEAHQNAANAFDNWLENYVNNQWQQTECGIAETMTCTYTKSEYHYTLYYYDQAANLVQTVPPKGVHPLDVNNPVHFGTDGNWPGSTPTNPPHDMESRYKFNSLEVAIESETPDGGLTQYSPDAMGRPMESRNAEQRKRASTLGSSIDIYSTTQYDNLGRIVAVAEIWAGYVPPTGIPIPIYQTTSTKYDTPVEIGQIGWKSENTRSRVSSVQYYEDNNTVRHAIFYSYDIHGNVKSMVTQVPALKNFGQEFHRVDYYYDLVSGKVNEVHYQPKSSDRIFYRYKYDADNRLITAETSRDYITWERDAKYFYYPHGPLKRVETGHRKVQGTDYFYTIHGWLKGVNDGALNQTYDVGRDGDRALSGNPNGLVARDAFGFTLDYYNGDYKAIGTTGMHHIPNIDPSGPGDALLERGLHNGNIARMSTALLRPDEQRLPVLSFGYIYDQLNRIKQNYAYLAPNLHTTNSWNGVMGSNAYYGNYSYDANGNILTLQRRDGTGTLRDNFTAYNYTNKSAYSSGQFYNYKGPQNRLDYIVDDVNSGDFSDDMDSQLGTNYQYDEIGNLVKDAAEEIKKIEWTVYGKVKSVIRETGSKKPDLYFYYTGSGQRYMKVIIPKNQTTGAILGKHDWKASYYQHDAQGNILAIYEIKGGPENCGYDMFLGEHVLYGSSRLGVATYKNLHLGYTKKSLAYPPAQEIYVCYEEADDTNFSFEPMGDTPTGPVGGNTGILTHYSGVVSNIGRVPITGVNLPWQGRIPQYTGNPVRDPANDVPTRLPSTFNPGRKRYEFSNHLGNVLVTISDMPIGVDEGNNGNVDYYMPDVKTTSDYEPFGAPLLERTFGGGSFNYTETLNVVTQIMDVDFDDLCDITYQEDFNDTCVSELDEDFTWDCTHSITEDFAPNCGTAFMSEDFTPSTSTTTLATQDFNAGTYDNTVFMPNGTCSLSVVSYALNFTTSVAGSGLKVVLPTTATGTYTVSFNYTEAAGSIPSTSVSVSGGNVISIVSSAGGLVEYTFTTNTATTNLIITPGGTGSRTGSVDNFTLVKNSQDFGPYKTSGTLNRLTFNNEIKYTTGSASNQGIKITVPTIPDHIYTARFHITDDPATATTITATQVAVSGGNVLTITENDAYVEYTFVGAASASFTDVQVILQGTGVKTATLDDFSVCENSHDLSFVKPNGVLSELSFNDKITFTTSSGTTQGVKFRLPTTPGHTYTARFTLDKITPATITSAWVSVSAGNQLTLNNDPNTVEYTFTVPSTATLPYTDLLVSLIGTGVKTATIDDFSFCENTRNFGYITQYGGSGELSYTNNHVQFSPITSGYGIYIKHPTVIGSTYTVSFDYTPGPNITLGALSGGNYNLSLVGTGTQTVNYTFKATATLTSILLGIVGTAPLSAGIDNLKICKSTNDYSKYTPQGGLTALSHAGDNVTFSSSANGQGLKVTVPTTSGKTYTARFNYMPVANISSASVQINGGPLTAITAGNQQVTFTAGAGSSTEVRIIINGTGIRTASIDDFSLCENDATYNIFMPQGTLTAPLNYAGGTLNFGTATSGNGVKTTLATTVGEEYTLTFDYVQGPNTTSASVDATGTAAQTIPSSGPVTYTFTATSTSTEIKVLLTGTSGTRTASLDNIRVSYEHEETIVHQWEGEGYRFGFNGQEKDDEVYGEGNSYTAEFWQYDPRIGRRWNVDPIVDVSWSSYSTFRNNPIRYNDPKGNTVDPKDQESKDMINRKTSEMVQKTNKQGLVFDKKTSQPIMVKNKEYDPEFTRVYKVLDSKPEIYEVEFGGVNGDFSYKGNGIFRIRWGNPENKLGFYKSTVLYEEFYHAFQFTKGKVWFENKGSGWEVNSSVENEYYAKIFASQNAGYYSSYTSDDGWTIPTQLGVIRLPDSEKTSDQKLDFLKNGTEVSISKGSNYATASFANYTLGPAYAKLPLKISPSSVPVRTFTDKIAAYPSTP